MKIFFSFGLLLPLLLGTLAARAQGVRIGATGAPDASAVLDIVSSNKGVLLPRVADVTTIASPAAGLLAYQTGGTVGYYYYSGGQWQQLATAAPAAAAGPTVGDVKQGLQTADHAGWVRLDGRATSTLTATQQARATALGIGANLPNATGKVLKQTSGNLLGTGGSNTATIDQTNLPNISLGGNTTSDGNHKHYMWTGRYTPGRTTAYDYVPTTFTNSSPNDYYTGNGGSHSHSVSVALGGSGTALPVEDAYLGINQFVYLGQ